MSVGPVGDGGGGGALPEATATDDAAVADDAAPAEGGEGAEGAEGAEGGDAAGDAAGEGGGAGGLGPWGGLAKQLLSTAETGMKLAANAENNATERARIAAESADRQAATTSETLYKAAADLNDIGIGRRGR